MLLLAIFVLLIQTKKMAMRGGDSSPVITTIRKSPVLADASLYLTQLNVKPVTQIANDALDVNPVVTSKLENEKERKSYTDLW